MLELTIDAKKTAEATDLKEGVARMIEEMKLAADEACAQLNAKIEQSRACNGPVAPGADDAKSPIRSERPAPPDRSPGKTAAVKKEGRAPSCAVPVNQIICLADEGLSAVEIARQVRVGLAEVELTLKIRRHRQSVQSMAQDDFEYVGKEVGIA